MARVDLSALRLMRALKLGFEIEDQPSFRRKFTQDSSLYVLIGWLVKRTAGGERNDG
jgi:hypothetical protein